VNDEEQGQLSLISGEQLDLSRAAFDPARLTQARRLLSLTKAELAELVKVSGAALGQYEAGVAIPRPDVLENLAGHLGQPVAYFAAGRPHARLDASMAHFRSLRSTRVKERAKAVAFVEQAWELQFALEKRVALPPVSLPGFGDVLPDLSGRQPQHAARVVRELWGCPKGPLPHLVRTLEVHGVIVTLLSLKVADEDNARIDAFSTSRMPRPIIVLTPDRANDVYRCRFTAAHELGHLLLHRDVHPGDVRQEAEANDFASALLTPQEQIAPELSSRVRIPRLQETAKRWGVSTKSLVLRSKELGLISDVSARRAYQRLQEMRTGGLMPDQPISLFPGEAPSMMRKAYDMAVSHGMTLGELAGELAWTPQRVEELLGLDPRPRLSLA
jgi:Zn-dependent peptidase ImmA (M78 family)/transcriptional regulator with XRE-family HTH domain